MTYKKIVEDIMNIINAAEKSDIGFTNICAYIDENCPELKENEDERIRKEIIDYIKTGTYHKDWIAWLEKQVSIDENEVAKCVLNEVANSIMRWLDANLAEGNMCLSNMECEDIENAVRNANWQKVYGYMKKKLEKQRNEKPAWSEEDEANFQCVLYRINSNPLLEDVNVEIYKCWLQSLKQRIGG